MSPVRIFISSVQSEFAQERMALRDHIRQNPWTRRFFEVFLFEEAPATDRRPDALYIDEVTRCDIYIGLFGLQYGSQDKEEMSPTEREFNHANKLGKCRLIYVKNVPDEERDPRMAALICKAEKEIVRKSFETGEDLRREIDESLVNYLLDNLFPHAGSFGNDRCRTSAEAEETLGCYTAAFRRRYPGPETMVPFNCRSAESEIPSDEVSRLISKERTDILLRGPSGCGKTLLAANVAIDYGRHGGVAIFIPVRNYSASLAIALDQEANLLDTPSVAKLLSAAQRLNRPILLVVDGYNECHEAEWESLTIELAAWARRYAAGILITSQVPPVRSDLLELRNIEVLSATMTTKVAIATNVMGVDVLPKEIEPLLGAVTTGLEARLVGQVGQHLQLGGSRFALFDAYARERLHDDASVGIHALSHVAGWLADRLAFSLSVRDLDRLMDEKHISPAIPERLQNARLLSRHGDRVSFVHEMFFNAFAAEAIVRRSNGRPEPVLTALAEPVHAERKDFIIGAIDEPHFREQVLDGLSDPKSVAVCLSGSCGRQVQEWAEGRYPTLLRKLRNEVREVRFTTSDRGLYKIALDGDSLATWSKSDRAFLGALPKLIMEGRYLDEIFNIIGTLDRRIDEESTRLRAEAREHDIPLRSAIFANCFVHSVSPAPAISPICVTVNSGFYRTDGDGLVTLIGKLLRRDDWSRGQLYLLLKLSKRVDITDIMTPFLTRTIKARWNHVPNHLALSLMEAAGMCWSASDADKSDLIQVIESLPEPRNWALSAAIVDALGFLGALEQSEREHHPVIREDVRRCLANPNDAQSCAKAYSIYSSQFDHPFCNAYCEAIDDLPTHERKLLLMMAAKGVDGYGVFLSMLIEELATYEDPEMGECFARYTELPPSDSPFPNDDVGVFVIAHIALGTLGYPLPARQRADDLPCAESLGACGTILYWISRGDLDEGTKHRKCRQALSALYRHRQDAALGALRLCDPDWILTGHFMEGLPENGSIAGYFPREVTDICRCALTCSTELIGYFRLFDRNESLIYAIDLLGRYGTSAELALLRRHVNDPNLGTRAVDAMKAIEQRLTAS